MPVWKDESGVIESMIYQYTEGNNSCDCNKSNYLARAYQKDEPDFPCGDTMPVKRLTLIKPDATEEVIWENE